MINKNQTPVEEHDGGALEQQFAAARRALAYSGPSTPPVESEKLRERFEEAARGAGISSSEKK